MAKKAKERGPAIEKVEAGMVFEELGGLKKALVVVDPEPNENGNIRLQDEQTEIVHLMSLKNLATKYEYKGRHVTGPGGRIFEPVKPANVHALGVAGERSPDPADPPEGEGADGAEPVGDDYDPAAHAAKARDFIREQMFHATRDCLLTDRYERLTVLKCEVECPCGDTHKIKEKSLPDFLNAVTHMVIRHFECYRVNELPNFHGDRIDPKQPPEASVPKDDTSPPPASTDASPPSAPAGTNGEAPAVAP